MRTVYRFFAISALYLVLSLPTLAEGQVDMPPVAKPPTQKTSTVEVTNAGDDEATADPILQAALDIIMTLLSVF